MKTLKIFTLLALTASLAQASTARQLNGTSIKVGATGGVLTLPNTTDTVTVNAATQTLTNKTLTSPVVSDVLQVGGSAPNAQEVGIFSLSHNDDTSLVVSNQNAGSSARSIVEVGSNAGSASMSVNSTAAGALASIHSLSGVSLEVGTRGSDLVTFLSNNTSRLTIAGAGTISVPAFSTAGVVHNAVTTGALSSSLIVNADITAGTIAAAKLVGSDIATVGTVTSGTWSATAISAAKGGTAIDTSASTGIPSIASGTWSVGALTGDVTSAARVTTVAKIAGTTVSGTTGSTNVVFSASPTVTGTLTTAAQTVGGNITFSSPSTQGIVGTTTNDSAAAGNVGEFLAVSGNTGGSATPGSTGTFTNVSSMSLTAGDWDVSGTLNLTTGGTFAGTRAFVQISKTTGGSDSSALGGVNGLALPAFSTSTNYYLPTGVRRISLSTTTTIYLTAFLNYTTLGATTYGSESYMSARRVR